jgi:hypothetical protein
MDPLSATILHLLETLFYITFPRNVEIVTWNCSHRCKREMLLDGLLLLLLLPPLMGDQRNNSIQDLDLVQCSNKRCTLRKDDDKLATVTINNDSLSALCAVRKLLKRYQENTDLQECSRFFQKLFDQVRTRIKINCFKDYVYKFLNNEKHVDIWYRTFSLVECYRFGNNFILWDYWENGFHICSNQNNYKDRFNWRRLEWEISWKTHTSLSSLETKLNRANYNTQIDIKVHADRMAKSMRYCRALKLLHTSPLMKEKISKWQDALWKPHGVMSRKAFEDGERDYPFRLAVAEHPHS